jgi:hypothetical protein
VIVRCDFCTNTAESVGLHQQEEAKAQGWSVRHGKVRRPACTGNERVMLARSIIARELR